MKTVEEIRKTYPDFKSPQELGITDEEYCAMNEVREGLCEGRYVHVQGGVIQDILKHPYGFNMSRKFTKNHCGSVGCIGGWMAHVMGYGAHECFTYVDRAENSSPQLYSLFYPRHRGRAEYNSLTPQQSAQAVANFMHGNTQDPWRNV